MARRRGLRKTLWHDSPLQSLVEDGLQALKRVDRDRLSVAPPSYVHDSLSLDERSGSTGEWDYLLGVDERARPVVAVEVHPATNGEVASVIKKKQRTLAALRGHMDASAIRTWYWIASGSDTVARGSTEWRRLVQAGILLVGRHLRLPP